ncbi:MAG: D-alanine--D-alanine ligase A [Thermoleophilia bacterium]
MGGRSSEHDISLASARSVVEALRQSGHDVASVEIGRDGRWSLASPFASDLPRSPSRLTEAVPFPSASAEVVRALASAEIVVPVLHGPFGEDGTVQGLLELLDLPYVGSGVAASAVCMDKDLMKAVLRDRGIPVTRSVTLRHGDPAVHPFDYPVFVKPARLGSSVGITKVRQSEELEPAVALARRHDDKVLIEEYVPGIEVECSVLGNERPVASLPGEIVAHGFSGEDWYDYSAKYDQGGMDLIVPPRIPPEQVERVREISVDAFVATECEGMARVDCFVRPDGQVLVNELNTIPGFTATSVYARLFEASGLPYTALLDRLIELALERHARRSALRY